MCTNEQLCVRGNSYKSSILVVSVYTFCALELTVIYVYRNVLFAGLCTAAATQCNVTFVDTAVQSDCGTGKAVTE